MTLSDLDLKFLLAKLGEHDLCNLVRTGEYTAEMANDLVSRLRAELAKREIPAVRPYRPEIGDQD